ncbi:MAG: acylphosphatase [Eubacterium sp.]|nr:acylphosphatase [Eubacterium sp.]
MNDKKIVRQSLIFYGDVQGVGFRYRAKYAAERLGLTGWVQNQFDGSVAMEVQGSPEEINEMIREISTGRFIDITGIRRKHLVVRTDESGFHVHGY